MRIGTGRRPVIRWVLTRGFWTAVLAASMLTAVVPVAAWRAVLAHALHRVPGSQLVQVHTATYYLSATGDDGHDGRSPATAWRSLSRASLAVLRPGDRVLLQGGTAFPGTLLLGPGDAGNAAAPVVVGSYGDGRATIEGLDGSGIAIHDTAGVEVRGVDVTGGPTVPADANGISLYNDLPGHRMLDHIVVSDVDVSGFADGIAVGSRIGTGFRDVEVADSRLYSNRLDGFATYGPAFDPSHPAYANEAVSLTRVEAFDNPGDPTDHVDNSGSGIVLGSVRDAHVSFSSAHDNGALCDSPVGPVGIWSYDSTDVVAEHDVAYQNHTGGKTDGGGFDLDQNVSSSVLQDNLSFDNDGPGYLLYTGEDNAALSDDTVRFNISSGDGSKWAYGGLVVWGRVNDAQVYHNTVDVRANGPLPSPALRLESGLSGVSLRDNLLMSDGAPLVTAAVDFTPAQAVLQGNDYFSSAQPWTVLWGGTSYRSLGAWRTATAQERLNGAVTGLDVDPGLTLPPDGAPWLTQAAAFVPGSGSPVVGRSLDLPTLFGTDEGPADYFDRPVGPTAAVGALQPATDTP